LLAPDGKVVKNIAGYALPKRLTGSFGILGIIAEVTFRLHPVQADSATWTITSDDLDALATVQPQISAAAMSVESLQIRSTEIGFALDVRFASLHEVLQEHEARLHRLCSPLTVRSSTNEVWRERERLFDIGRAAILKITAPPLS